MSAGRRKAGISPRLVLASASPRRRQLLQEHGYAFTVVTPKIAERTPPHLSTGEAVLMNAKAKASAVAAQYPNRIVLGVDTLVALDGRALGKPRDATEAFAMISALNGRAHEVFSGVWVICHRARKSAGFIERSVVHFRKLTRSAITRYLRQIDPLDKAGGYAAQTAGSAVIDRIEGSLSNVIGLPMEQLALFLRNY